MKRKAQSALEYMMTYGWAILIIVIVAAVLYSMGIFNPSSSTGTTATGFTPFTVLAQACTSHSLEMQIGNNAGQTVNVTQAKVSTSTGLSATTATVSYSPTILGVINSGGSQIVNFTTTDCATAGSRYSATITVSYTQTSSLGTQSLQATGTIAGTAS